jgi:hypothetical protein
MASTNTPASMVTPAASQGQGITLAGLFDRNNRNNRSTYGYNNGTSFVGTVGRVDQGQRVFRLYTSNGQSYHVDASNATIVVNGNTTSFSALPTTGTVRVIGTMENNGSISASEVDYGTNGYNNGGYGASPANPYGYNNNGYNNNRYHNNRYGHGYNNGTSFVGTVSRVDENERAFRLYTTNGQSYHVDASNATIVVNGNTTSFGQLPTNGTVQVIGTLGSNGNIIASQVDYGTNGYNNGGYGASPANPYGYNNNGYNNNGASPANPYGNNNNRYNRGYNNRGSGASPADPYGNGNH